MPCSYTQQPETEKSVDDDDTFFIEQGTIQCYTERFNSGEYLAFFRSPFNSQNNLTYLHNTFDIIDCLVDFEKCSIIKSQLPRG